MGIGVLCKDALVSGVSDRPRPRRSERAQMASDFFAVARYEHFQVGSRNISTPSHASVIKHAAAPAASKMRVGGENPYRAMLSRLMFRTARGVEFKGVVILGVDMAEIPHVLRARFIIPAAAPDRKRSCGRLAAARRKNSSTLASRSGSRFPRNPSAGFEPGIGRDAIVRAWIERIVNRHTALSSQSA